jgi:hypothetical protein
LAGLLAFPLIVNHWGMSAYQWFLLVGAAATGAVVILGDVTAKQQEVHD